MGVLHLTPQQFANARDAYVSSQNASFVAIALFALMMYEYLITFEEERKNFWKGPFSVSHALFFFNRYFSIFIVSLSLLLYTKTNPTDDFCRNTIRGSIYASGIGLGVIQAILITRVWFLFPGNRTVYFGLLFSFTVTFLMTMVFMGLSLGKLTILSPQFFNIKGFVSQAGCHAKRPPAFGLVYLPSLVLHTGLYVLTLYQSVYGAQWSKKRALRRLLIVDGSLFYLIVLASVALVTIGSFLKDGQARTLNLVAIYTPIVICTTSIATSRIMFGLRSYFLEVENNLGWEMNTVLTAQRQKKASLTDSLRSTIILPLPKVYRGITSFGPHYHVHHDPIEEEKGRAFDMKMASIFDD